MKKGVQILELDFLSYDNLFEPVPYYVLRQNVLGSKHIEYVGYKSLKVLDLKFVDVTGNVLEDILSNCLALERLSVSDSSKLVFLTIMSPSAAFKYLVIRRCYELRRVQIHDANLVSFVNDVDGPRFYSKSNVVELHLKNLPLLVEVSLGGKRSLDFLEVASEISCCLAQLEVLILNNFSMIYRRKSVFPTLCNLKHLELALDERDNSALLRLCSFMKAAPLLHTLVLQLLVYSVDWKIPFPNKKAAKCLHNNLKVVEIVKFAGTTRQIEFVNYVTQAAMSLEKIVFHIGCSHRCYRSRVDRLLESKVKLEEWRRKCLSHVRKFKKILPASVEVVCLELLGQ